MLSIAARSTRVLLVLIALASSLSAAEPPPPPTVLTSRLDTAWSEQAWIAGMEVEVSGVGGDDVFVAAANRAAIDGLFSNSLIVAASEVRLRGRVADHVRIAALNATVHAQVSNSVTAASAQSLLLSTNSSVGGNVYAMGQALSVLGQVDGSVHLLGRKATLGGRIGGSVRVSADDIVLLPGTEILGDLVYVTTNRDLTLGPTVTVNGEVRRSPWTSSGDPLSWQTLLVIRGFLLLAAIMVGIPFLLVFPAFMSRAIHLARTQAVTCGFVGSLSALAVPVICVLALVSGVGFALALVLGGLYAILLYLARFIIAVWVGGLLLRQQGRTTPFSASLALVLGLTVSYATGTVPGVGPILTLLATLYGAGSMILVMVKPKRLAQTATATNVNDNPQSDNQP